MAKREKHVFSGRDEVTHAWAHQVSSYGKRGDGRMFFEQTSGDYPNAKAISTIYSYGHHFAIATLYERLDNNIKFVLFTTRNYSSSTGCHKNAVRYSVNHLKIFNVHDPMHPKDAENYFKRQIAEELAEVTNPKKQRILSHMRNGQLLVSEANELAELFGFDWRLDHIGFDEATKTRAAELEDKYEARQKNLAEKRAIRDAEKRRINAMSVQERIAQWRENPKAQLPWGYDEYFTDEDRVIYAKREEAKIEEWRKGGAGVDAVFRAPEVYMRIKGNEIQTSKGARFPVEHGIKAWPVVKRCRDKQIEWQTNGHTVHLGPYKLDRIEADGTVVAGCHRVGFGEVERIAKELGLT